MTTIATLGPKGTFSEVACEVLLQKTSLTGTIEFFPSIGKVFAAVSSHCDYGVLPVENSLDGFVQPTLDWLLKSGLQILSDVTIPVQFAFVANAPTREDVKEVYIQFKTQGQCAEFVDTLESIKIITTESNGEALEKVLQNKPHTAAIIPNHILSSGKHRFELVNDPVTDSKENETRFILFSAKQRNIPFAVNSYRTSLVIKNSKDRPGELLRIITEFAIGGINLKYIMSRPTKESLGKYIFFIDIDGNAYTEEKVIQAIENIRRENEVFILGVYGSVSTP